MFLNYFLEIKNRLILLFIIWSSTFLICYHYKIILLFILITPTLNFFKTNSFYFIFTNPMEVFHIYLKISYFISIQITMVFFCFYFLVFISPGLFNFEHKKIWYSWGFCVVLWIIILLYMYNYLLPWSWKFFLSFQHFSSNQNINIYFESKLSEFFNFCFYFFNIIFIIYIIFIILCLYINFLLKNIQFIKNFRKNFYFMFFVIASLITPPDIISQILVGLIIIIFYEIIILFYFVNNKFKKY